jgi:aryl-alcohol dehydrogenase-like predicted oxidoreductase
MFGDLAVQTCESTLNREGGLTLIDTAEIYGDGPQPRHGPGRNGEAA